MLVYHVQRLIVRIGLEQKVIVVLLVERVKHAVLLDEYIAATLAMCVQIYFLEIAIVELNRVDPLGQLVFVVLVDKKEYEGVD